MGVGHALVSATLHLFTSARMPNATAAAQMRMKVPETLLEVDKLVSWVQG